MTVARVASLEESIVIRFGTEAPRINAYTLATTLINIADAAKAANAIVNPGYEIEVVVEALGAGSFRARIRGIYRSGRNLFSAENVRNIVLSIIASFIYEHTIGGSPDVVVNVGPTEVVVEQGEQRIVIPRTVHEAMQQVADSPQFRKGVGQALRAVEEDPTVTSISIGSEDEPGRPPPPVIPRERFAVLPRFLADESLNERELVETTDLEILRAILERSTRRWEFAWNGMKISAPVTDQNFYDDFFAHRITIAPGDALRVRLRIRQRRAADLGIFMNSSYEVVEVLSRIPRAGQEELGVVGLP